MFTIVRCSTSTNGPRLARLIRPGRNALETPNYLASTSRGTVPHLTPDTLARSTDIQAVYTGLEDFIEKAPQNDPPIYHRPLRQFIAVPSTTLLVLGARRSPPVIAPRATSNTDESIAICTSVGFRYLNAKTYAQRAEELGVDIIASLADVPYGRALGSKRIEAATDRSIEWLQQHIEQLHRGGAPPRAALFATLLPVSVSSQQYYVDAVEENLSYLDGLAVHSLDTLEDLPERLRDLPRLGLTEAQSPLHVLNNIENGVDILVLPFIDTATDAGLALDFSFESSVLSMVEKNQPIAIDMWSAKHATDLSPITPNCTCYACVTHHRAYIHHLLNAKEMLGWVLLQIHNHHIVNRFFQHIRTSIQMETFTADAAAFVRRFDAELPQKTGQGPRIRGYQRKTEGRGEPKANDAAFIKYQASLAGKAAQKSVGSPNITTGDILDVDFDLNLFEEEKDHQMDIKDTPGDRIPLNDGRIG